MNDLEPVPEHPRGMPLCDCCGGSGLREIREAPMQRHIPTGRFFCGRCVARGCHTKPLLFDRPVTLADPIR